MAIVTSKQFTLDTRDLLRGLLMAVIVPVLTIIENSIAAGTLTFNWKAIGIAAIAGGVGYLLKNFLTPSSIVVEPASNEQVDKINEGTASVKVVEHG